MIPLLEPLAHSTTKRDQAYDDGSFQSSEVVREISERVERQAETPDNGGANLDAIATRKEGEDRDQVFRKVLLYGKGNAPTCLTVNLSKLFERVIIGLNGDPDKFLEEVYTEGAA